MQYHELANMFPMIDGDEYETFKADIEENGQLEPILLYDGQIVDGRNRYRACTDLGIDPIYHIWDGDIDEIAAYIVSKNLYRRHLTASQRAAIALDVLPELERENPRGGDRRSSEFQSGNITTLKNSEKAASMFNIGEKYVRDAKSISKYPDLLEQVKMGDMTLPKAKIELRKRDDNAKVEALKRDREVDPYDYDARFDNWPIPKSLDKFVEETPEIEGLSGYSSKGYAKLATAVVCQAIKDAVKYPFADCPDNPQEWLLSDDCRYYCEGSGNDHELITAWVDMGCPTTPMHETLMASLTNNL